MLIVVARVVRLLIIVVIKALIIEIVRALLVSIGVPIGVVRVLIIAALTYLLLTSPSTYAALT